MTTSAATTPTPTSSDSIGKWALPTRHTPAMVGGATPTELIVELDLLERRFGRTTEDLAGRLEARAVARAIPGRLGLVPADEAAHVGADRRKRRHLAARISVRRHALFLEGEDLTFTRFQVAK